MQASPPTPRRSSLNRSSSDINPLLRPVKPPPKSGQYFSRDMANDLEMMSYSSRLNSSPSSSSAHRPSTNTSRSSTILSPAFAPNKSRINAGSTEKSTCTSSGPWSYPTSKTRIGKHGPHISAVHIKPCLTIRFNPPAEHITPPIWLRSELSNHRNMPIRPLLLLPLKTRTPPPPQQEHLHLKRPLPDADADVEMIEQILVVVDVAVVLVDAAAEISEEISLEIPTLGALTVRFRDTLPPIAIPNTRIRPPIRVSTNGVLLNRLHLHHILHRSRRHPMLLLHLPQIVILNSPQKITAVATPYDPAAVSRLQKIRGSTIPHVRNT